MGKEEDKIEKLIRGLIRLPENRRCINCNALGPQYVCTTFWTFVCTNCSGVHREFNHRVKSVSMAKFSMEEVRFLQVGGNEKAREIYLKTWNPQRNAFPENSIIQKLRDFIKQVYVDRRYTGDNHPASLPRLRNSDKEDSYERARSIDRHTKYISDEVRSPGYKRETNERHSRYSNNEVRSPGYSRENYRYGGQRASSSRFESTDGRYQVDDARIAGRSATQMFTTEDIKPKRTSPDRQRGREDVNSPRTPIRNVRELLGDKFVALRVGEQPRRSAQAAVNTHVGEYGSQNSPRATVDQSKTSHRRTVSAYTQNTVKSSNQTPTSSESLKPKSGSEGSLVDFASFPAPPSPPDASISSQGLEIQAPSNGTNSTSSQPPVKENVSRAPPKNTLEFLLFELSTPAQITPSDQSENTASPAASGNGQTSNHMATQSNQTNAWPNLQMVLATAQDYAQTSCPSAAATDKISNSGTISMPQFRQVEKPDFPTPQIVPDFLWDEGVADSSSTTPQTSRHENSNNQATTLFPESSVEVAFANSTAQSSKPEVSPAQETKPAAGIQLSGRAELPEDLFSPLYPSRTVSAPAWQMSPSYGMGFNMQYYQNAPMHIPPFSNVAKSVNPFDTSDDQTPHQFTMMSSTPVQGGFPSAPAPSSVLRTQSFGSHLQGFTSAQSPNYHISNVADAYMEQNSFSNFPPSSQQEVGGFGGGATLGSLHSNQHLPYQYQTPTDSRTFPTGGGNPYG